MLIYLTRHGQTRLNRQKLMQGLSDEPLNETGISQAEAVRRRIGDLSFDAVYASPLSREEDVIRDRRIIETDFGPYEQRNYALLGPAMTLYWALPELFPAPKGVESTASMVKRSREFLQELEQKDYERVLVACHGGIIRSLRGYLEDCPRGYRWRPKPKNCELRVYEYKNGSHRFVEAL